MKFRFFVSMALAGMLACAPAVETHAVTYSHSSKGRSASRSGGTLKGLFQNNIGRYPFQVGLLKKPALKARLVKLLGQSRYNYMVKNFEVQTPIEFGDWNYHVYGMQAHSGGDPGFDISYNPEKDALAVRWEEGGTCRVYKEKPSVNASWDY